MKKILLLSLIALGTLTVKAATIGTSSKLTMVADTGDTPLTISGSVDAYYKYDFAKSSQIPTSFASDHNSFSIGMVDIALKKTTGKTSFVGEVSFGPRGQSQSIPDQAVTGGAASSYHIQNLYVNYAATDALTFTMGYMATFVGYEVISPVGNFNYSTSYLFTNGPFQNAGFKATYAFSSKASLMAGVFNDGWNYYSSMGKIDNFGAQLFVSPVDGWNAYLNVITGGTMGTEFDLTTAYQVTSAFKLGLNAADYTLPGSLKGGFSGVALYPQLAVSSGVTLGLRGEYFKAKAGALNTYGPVAGESVSSLTATANFKSGNLTIIPEFRFDNGSTASFMNKSAMATKKASQALLAVVYAF